MMSAKKAQQHLIYGSAGKIMSFENQQAKREKEEERQETEEW